MQNGVEPVILYDTILSCRDPLEGNLPSSLSFLSIFVKIEIASCELSKYPEAAIGLGSVRHPVGNLYTAGISSVYPPHHFQVFESCKIQKGIFLTASLHYQKLIGFFWPFD
tara:strand:- start:186 stop:518 length:333 start_codon:yes stop_codon:yes gene_type:complete